MSDVPFERFPILDAIPVIRHGFVLRVPGIAVDGDKPGALRALAAAHETARAAAGLGSSALVTAEQVHGARVAVAGREAGVAPGADALVTDDPGVCLGIYVADCCPIFLVDPERRCIGLVHSGKKGTDLGVVGETVDAMIRRFDAEPASMVALLGPCIRPPWYEIDFAATIARQCELAGIGVVCDCGITTASDLDRYYSYRVEKGRTGRMLALLGLAG